MDLSGDLASIEWAAQNDTAMAGVAPDLLREGLARVRTRADQGDPAEFLLDAMALFALAGNGHTRIIPNAAISVFPRRFLWCAEDLWCLTEEPRKVTLINGASPNDIWPRLQPYLAGTPMRQRVIGALALAWPHALQRAGIAGPGQDLSLAFSDGTGCGINSDAMVPATDLYPTFETGAIRADPDHGVHDGCVVLRFSSFANDGMGAASRVSDALDHLVRHPSGPVLVDLRGNPGGDFIIHLPVIDAILKREKAPVAVLVDRFTFSAAIVFAGLCKARLRALLIGEEMGDRGTFHAEGGTLDLPQTGAALRWSDGFHDWTTGKATGETPAEIAKHMIGAGSLMPDIHAVSSPADLHHGRDPALQTAIAALRTTGRET